MAAYHKNGSILKNKAPLDAFLGETFQARKSDGSEFFVEHTSSDPPRSNYLLVGPKNLYKLYGSGEVNHHFLFILTFFLFMTYTYEDNCSFEWSEYTLR